MESPVKSLRQITRQSLIRRGWVSALVIPGVFKDIKKHNYEVHVGENHDLAEDPRKFCLPRVVMATSELSHQFSRRCIPCCAAARVMQRTRWLEANKEELKYVMHGCFVPRNEPLNLGTVWGENDRRGGTQTRSIKL